MKHTKLFVIVSVTFLSSLAIGIASHVHAAALSQDIITRSPLWRSTTAPVGGNLDWTLPNYDDSSWHPAVYIDDNGLISAADIRPGTNAQLMWHRPDDGPWNGFNGPNEAFFRHEFNLDLTSVRLPILGQALVIADDVMDMWVNGVDVITPERGYPLGVITLDDNLGPDGEPDPVFVDFTSFLRNGANVIAIRANDGTVGQPSDRLAEFVFFDGSVTSVPEPSQIALIGSGLLGLGFATRRQRKALYSDASGFGDWNAKGRR